MNSVPSNIKPITIIRIPGPGRKKKAKPINIIVNPITSIITLFKFFKVSIFLFESGINIPC